VSRNYVAFDVKVFDAHGSVILSERVHALSHNLANRRARWLAKEAGQYGKVARTSARLVKDRA
jgi:hypothetical protein